MYPIRKSSLKLLPLAALAGLAFGAATISAPKPAAACSDQPYMGAVCMVGFTYCPRGYIEANGQILLINQYQALYSLYGTTYGGDGVTTFGIPDFRGRSPVGIGQNPYTGTTVTLGQKRGTETVTLTIDQMPSHTHEAIFEATTAPVTVNIPGSTGDLAITTTFSASTANGASTSPSTTNNTLSKVAGPPSSPYGPGGGTNVPLAGVTTSVTGTPAIPARTAQINTVTGGKVSVGDTGGGLPQPNIPPQAAIKFCVATLGIYPSRPD